MTNSSPPKKIEFRWEWQLKASPEAFWPFIADTNRFNVDRGNVPYQLPATTEHPVNGVRQIQIPSPLGMLAWEEEPFEWVYPHRYGVNRRFSAGIMTELRTVTELNPLPNGGTQLVCITTFMPRHAVGAWIINNIVKSSTYNAYDKAIRRYDLEATKQKPIQLFTLAIHSEFAPGGLERLATAQQTLINEKADSELVGLLADIIKNADDLALLRLRPYALADYWEKPRRQVLELCLWATRAGLLSFRWDVLCPLCRGAKRTGSTLSDVQTKVHCEACNIDFEANFDQSVELTFRPNPNIRQTPENVYCVGGPQLTPHIIAQQLLAPGERRELRLAPLKQGRYRIRALELRGGQPLQVTPEGAATATLRADAAGWPDTEIAIGRTPTLQLENATPAPQLFIFERTAWNDQAATAAEVTALQVFRDLFANEALRPGENFSVGSITVLFTDLRGSTRLYRENGDAVAFGRVMSHFDILRDTLAEYDGALVKTIGDAVMAVFLRPVRALQAVRAAQTRLAADTSGPPLQLKAGIHYGPCVAVTLNDRLDYFGSTVNLAARLEGLSAQKEGVVVSGAVHDDPEVAAWLASGAAQATPFEAKIKGFEGEEFNLWVVQ